MAKILKDQFLAVAQNLGALNFAPGTRISWRAKEISRLGTPKIDDFGAFFKNRCPKFLPTRKKRVFGVADFF